VPLFMYVALQDMHAPNQVPESYSNLYPKPTYSEDFAIMNGMATVADEVLGNMTAEMRARGLWASTLLIHTSDNGGPAGLASSGHAGNNWPLRGGKTNLFEGGIRVAAFVAGGYLPQHAQGTEVSGYIHGCDWYPTFMGLAGVSPNDNSPGVPGIDGMDMWPYLTGAAAASPRTEMVISSEYLGGEKWNAALITGDYKLVVGTQSYGFWMAPNYPNSSTNHKTELPVECGEGCLFDIQKDPSEYHDLAAEMPALLHKMRCRLLQLNATSFEAGKVPVSEEQCGKFRDAHKGFLVPYLTSDAAV